MASKYRHEPGHGIAQRIENHGPATWCFDPIEYDYGGGSKPSVLVDLGGILSELVGEFAGKDEKVLNALLADPLNIALQLGPLITESDSDYLQASHLTDDERAEVKPRLQALVVALLMLEASGVLGAIDIFCAANVKTDTPVSFLIKPGSPLESVILKAWGIHADLMPSLYHAQARQVFIDAFKDAVAQDASVMVKDSIHVLDGHLSPVALAMLAKAAA